MQAASPVPRLTGIIEAIDLIRIEMTGVTLEAFEAFEAQALAGRTRH